MIFYWLTRACPDSAMPDSLLVVTMHPGSRCFISWLFLFNNSQTATYIASCPPTRSHNLLETVQLNRCIPLNPSTAGWQPFCILPTRHSSSTLHSPTRSHGLHEHSCAVYTESTWTPWALHEHSVCSPWGVHGFYDCISYSLHGVHRHFLKYSGLYG
jgi:hypothetical protein